MADPEHTRDLYLRRTYNISLAEYRSIVAAQDGVCPICQKPLEGISNPVDHDHKTGVVRGVLHTYCNHRVLGRMREWEVAQRMAWYLKDHPATRAVGHRQVPPKKPKRRGSGKKGAK
jgi:hypothetical protein